MSSPGSTLAEIHLEGGLIHLQASDDAIIPISRFLLAAHSTFFADLPDFLHFDKPGKAIIPLHTATSAGLTVLARLLPYVSTRMDNVEWKRKPPSRFDFMRELNLEDLPGIANALDLARTYDIDGFLVLFNGAGQSVEGERPLFAWSLSAITEKWMNVNRRAMKTLRSEEILPDSALHLLRELSPKRLERLLAIRKEWKDATSALWTSLTEAKAGEDYADGCKGWKGLFGCTAKSMIPKWKDMRMIAGKKIYGLAIRAKTDLSSESLAVVSKVVPCSTCAKRLNTAFRGPLRKFWIDTLASSLHDRS